MTDRSSMLLYPSVAALPVTSFAGAEQVLIHNELKAKWSDAPAMLPPGAKIDVVRGDPGGNGSVHGASQFPRQLQDTRAFPSVGRARDRPLRHALHGDGRQARSKGGTALTVGGFALMPAKMNHYAYTKKATTILLHGMGPVEFIHVNPADDPRNAGQALTAP